MNIYLTGHGFIDRTSAAVQLPVGISVVFYCGEDTEFDSTWERDVISGAAAAGGYRPGQGAGQFNLTRIDGPATTINHLLTRPGGLRTARELSDMGEIDTDLAAGCRIDDVVDGDVMCIKNGGKVFGQPPSQIKPTTMLSDIVAAFAGSRIMPVTLHWCACRSSMSDEGSITEQARSSWGGITR